MRNVSHRFAECNVFPIRMIMTSSQLKILLVSNSFNSMTQRIDLECRQLDHEVHRYEFESAGGMIAAVHQTKPHLIICPYLTKKVPPEIFNNKQVPCLIVHPGIEGDRGPTSIDWALRDNEPDWGVTILQAEDDMDTGDIWDTNTFPTNRKLGGTPTKSSLYRFEIIDAAVKGVKKALELYQKGQPPRKPDLSNPAVRGRLRPMMKLADRTIDWSSSAAEVCRLIRASDSQPGTPEMIDGQKYFLYNSYVEERPLSEFDNRPQKAVLATRHGAVLLKCGSGAVWVTHLRKPEGIKLPATAVLPKDTVDLLPTFEEPPLNIPVWTVPNTFQEIFTWEQNQVCYIWADFYNGAMNTDQCTRLANTLSELKKRPDLKVLVLMGGLNFWSNGINLNTIEGSADPVEESWKNINAIDDVVKEILLCLDKVTISAMYGNSGAGGVMAAIAADLVWAHDGVVLNPSYKRMDLYGSEYWTYSLPNRVGEKKAVELTDSEEPVSAQQALEMKLIDAVITPSVEGFVEKVMELATNMVDRDLVSKIIEAKMAKDEFVLQPTIAAHRQQELEKMKKCFSSEGYNAKRRAFVYKYRIYRCLAPASAAPTASDAEAIGKNDHHIMLETGVKMPQYARRKSRA